VAEPVIIPVEVHGWQAARTIIKSLREDVADLEKSAKGINFGGRGGGVSVPFSSSLNASFSGAVSHGRPGPATDYMGIGDRINNAIDSMVARGLGGMGLDLFKSGLALATEGLRTFATALITDVVVPFTKLETTATQIANASGGKLIAPEITGMVRAEKLRSNIGEDALLEAATKFQDITGQSKLAFEMLDTIGMLTKGRGGSASEQAAFAASVYKPGMGKADLDKLLMAMVGQGDIGAIPLAQMAKLGGKIVAPAGEMGGEYSRRIVTSTGLLQAARPGFGTTDLASTGLNTFFTNISTNMAKLEKAGFGQFFETGAEGKRVVSDPAQLIGALLAKTSGNISGLKELGFTDPGARFTRAFSEQFKGGFEAAKGRGETDEKARESAGKAVAEYIKTFINATSSMEAESKKRDAVMATTGERWESAMNRIKDKMLSVMPGIEKLVDSFEQRAPDIADAAEKIALALVDVADFLDSWVIGRDTSTKEGRARAESRDTRQFARQAEVMERAGLGGQLSKYLGGESAIAKAREEAIAGFESGQTSNIFRARAGTTTRGYTEESEQKARKAESAYFRGTYLKEIEAAPERGLEMARGALQRGELTKEQFAGLEKFAGQVTKASQDFGTLNDALLEAVKNLNKLAESGGEAAKAKPLGQ